MSSYQKAPQKGIVKFQYFFEALLSCSCFNLLYNTDELYARHT